MKTLLACLAIVVIALAPCFAQAPNPASPAFDGQNNYVVQPGDSLYALEGAFSGKPWQWRKRLVELNPFLKSPGRTWVNEKGRTIVLIRPGEELRGLAQLGIVPQPFPLEQLRRVDVPLPPAPTPLASKSAPSRDGSWLWRLLFLILTSLFFLAVVAWMRQDPAAAGPPIVRGGVRDSDAADAIRSMASRQSAGFAANSFIVRNLTRGHLYGAMRVRYNDGRERTMLMAGGIGYRALVEFPNGPQEEMYLLQACGNDLRTAGISRYIPGFGFRFVPEAAVEEAPPSAPVAPTPAPAPAPAPTPTPAPEQPQSESSVPAEKYFTFRPAGGGRPNLVDFGGFSSFEVEVKDGRTTVRFS